MIKMQWNRLALGLSVLFSATTIYSQAQSTLKLKSGTYDLDELATADQWVGPNASEIYKGHYFRLIGFNKLPSIEQQTELANAGIKLIDYLPEKIYIADIDQTANLNTLIAFGASYALPIKAEYKMTPRILNKTFPKWATLRPGSVDLNINYYQSLDKQAVLESLVSIGVSVEFVSNQGNYITVRVMIGDVDKLVAEPYISFVEAIDPPSEPENYGARTLHRSNVISADYPMGRQYNGDGINVMMQDDGSIGPHVDYHGRIPQQFTTNFGGDHGDHVSGTIMGAGNKDPLARGMAWGADLFVYGAAPQYPGFNDFPNAYSNLGITLTSTSYSNGCNAGYTSLARTMDLQVKEYEALMHIFSAGNSNNSDCGYGAGNQWGNITGGHKVGKNVIAVANLNNTGNISSSSSRGPAHDGRIKPDVSAKGSNVYSTTALSQPHDYTSKSGTSMSCPGVSGTMAQLYHAYRDLNNGNLPDAGLMKAVMMNTCDDIGNPGPDFIYGYGQINALRAVQVLESQAYHTGFIVNGDSINTPLIVPAGLTQLKLMVYWSDTAAAANAAKALVNDINIKLIDQSGAVTYLPLVLDPTPNTAALSSTAVPAVDSLNNAEQIVIDNPIAGTYNLVIEGTNIPFGPQEFHWVYDYIGEDVTVTQPNGGESFVPGEIQAIRWDAPLNTTGVFTIEYSANNGNTWSTLSSMVNPNVRSYNWLVPNNVTGEALIRVSRGFNIDISDNPFTVIDVPQNITSILCGDTLEVHWDTVNNASRYEVYLLGNKYMDSVASVATTSARFFLPNPNQENWISVAAAASPVREGRRAIGQIVDPVVAGTDLTITEIITPNFSPDDRCKSASGPLEVTVANLASTPPSSIIVGYMINGVVQNTVTPTTTLCAGDEINVVLSSTPITINPGDDLKMYVTANGDNNVANDTMWNPLIAAIAPPYFQNFDNFSQCGTESNCGVEICDLMEGWTNSDQDDIDWRTNQLGTPSNGTGPSADHTTGGPGHYLYLESSSCSFQEAELVSPCFDLSGQENACARIFYHMRGNTVGTLRFDVYSNDSLIANVAPPLNSSQGNNWIEAFMDLSQFANQQVTFKFTGRTGSTFSSDIAIDDFELIPQANASFSYQQIGVHWDSIQFINNTSLNSGVFTYFFGDNTSETGTSPFNPIHKYPGPGNYSVMYVVENSCGIDTLTQEINIEAVGVDEINKTKNWIAISPNPNGGQFDVEFIQAATDAKLQIIDPQGRIVLNREVSATRQANRLKISLKNLSAGIYYLNYEDAAGGNQVLQFVVQ